MVLEVKGVSAVTGTLEVVASTLIGELLELESNVFKVFTNPPELFVTKSLIYRATLNRVDKFFFLLQTCQIAITRATRRETPINTCTIRITSSGMDNG